MSTKPKYSWNEQLLEEAVAIIRGISFPSGAKANAPFAGSIACLRTANVQQEVDWEDLWHVSQEFVRREDQLVQPNDILISNANSLELVGKVALVRSVSQPATLGTFITLFRTRAGNDPRFVYFQLASPEVQRSIRANASTTTNISNVSTKKLAQIPLRFPSLEKQQRIVAEIEKQFTRLEAGLAGLRRVQANLKRYRAAVLKAACEGKLVANEVELAKAEGRKVETGAELLERILAERRKNWTGRGKYKEPAAPDVCSLPPLPEGWTWATVEQLAGLIRNGISAKPEGENGLPILRISAVRALSVNLSDVRFLNGQASHYNDFILEEGDLLFTRYNGNPQLVGACGVVPLMTHPVTHPDKLIRCKVVPPAIPAFVAIMANTGISRQHLAMRVRTTAGQAGISGGDLKEQPIPLPPLAEQIRIVAEVERRLSIIDGLAAIVATNLQRASRMRQSILQRAFAGELVS